MEVSFILSFIHQLLSMNNFSHIDNVLGIENMEVNKTCTVPVLMELIDKSEIQNSFKSTQPLILYSLAVEIYADTTRMCRKNNRL